VNHEVEISFA
jgi:apoptosis-inducing factor 3